ncbi:MAG: (deoxy)nucleoside triphosphate pyrophosphohydrolase [Gammaproteobacteria bacterium]|nr:(deoxy)nucleoside triphosphate pyrophosphohydrolase [Gammaproteobacteria bacterium]
MPTTAPDSRLHVAVGILRRGRRYLIQRRLPGTPCAGQWEFPGGKVEAGESPRRALARELDEELGVEALTARPLMKLPFDYTHARVWLEVFVVDSFAGEAAGREGQQIRWHTLDEIRGLDILAAVPAILDALSEAAAPYSGK